MAKFLLHLSHVSYIPRHVSSLEKCTCLSVMDLDMSVGRTVERVIIVSFIWLAAAHAILDVSITQTQEKIDALNLRTILITPHYPTYGGRCRHCRCRMGIPREYYICKTHKSFSKVTAAMQHTCLEPTARKFLACFLTGCWYQIIYKLVVFRNESKMSIFLFIWNISLWYSLKYKNILIFWNIYLIYKRLWE